MKIPYVIDNQTHRLSDILDALLQEHKGRSLDVATAYLTVGGFGLVREGLLNLGNLRLLLGAEAVSGEQIGLRPDPGVIKGLIRKDLEILPFDEKTLTTTFLTFTISSVWLLAGIGVTLLPVELVIFTVIF